MDEINEIKKRITLAKRYKMFVNLSEVYKLKIELIKKDKKIARLNRKLAKK